MKTAIKISIILAMLFATTANAQKTSIWQRVSVGATFNQVGTQNVQLGSGFLINRPNRAIGTTVSMRLWKRFEVGGYLSTMHSFPFGHELSYGANSDLRFNYHWDDNDLHVTGGVLMAIHALPIGSDFAIDYVLRGGFGLSGETDGVWGGIGMEVHLTRQLIATLYYDYGGFPFGVFIENLDGESNTRMSIGLKLNLK
jgi:hypothetical protein